MQITARPDSAGIIAILIGIAVDPSDPSGNTVYLAASRRSCAGVEAFKYRAEGRGPPAAHRQRLLDIN